MKELVVISGKGGTGKTSVSAALAALAQPAVLADCDVDAADLHLILGARTVQCEPFVSGHLARVIPEKCTACGLCASLCRFGAISLDGTPPGRAHIHAQGCEGCRVCVQFCPQTAIEFEPRLCGESMVSRTRLGMMSHARLCAGAENSGKLVSLVRRKARDLAKENGSRWLIVDGPPGIACPVIASITGADAVLLVTEPSLSAAHDLGRVVELCRHFGIRAFCLINRFDINPAQADRIAADMAECGVTVIGRIPYDPTFTRAQVSGCSLPESVSGGDTLERLKSAFSQLETALFNVE